jgi:hypothetical protein
MYQGIHVKYSLFLSDFIETLLLSTYFRNILKYQIARKSVQWEPSCSMRTEGQVDRQTHMTRLIVSFGSSVSASKNERDILKSPQNVHCLLYWSHKNKSHGWVAELQPFCQLPYPSLSPTVISHPAQNLCQCYQHCEVRGYRRGCWIFFTNSDH